MKILFYYMNVKRDNFEDYDLAIGFDRSSKCGCIEQTCLEHSIFMFLDHILDLHSIISCLLSQKMQCYVVIFSFIAVQPIVNVNQQSFMNIILCIKNLKDSFVQTSPCPPGPRCQLSTRPPLTTSGATEQPSPGSRSPGWRRSLSRRTTSADQRGVSSQMS